jgi:predicted nucleotidyltransferase
LKIAGLGYQRVMADGSPEFSKIEATLKKSAAALRDAGVPFALGGSLAAWVRGGPESCNDLDLVVRKEDAERALAALAETGMKPEHPPEGWLLKAWDGDLLVDLIYQIVGTPITDEVLERADELSVFSLPMRVLRLEDVVSSKLLALNDHELDYEPVLGIVRAVREQLDWDEVASRTGDSPYARAFFALMDELGLSVERRHEDASAESAKIRVIPADRAVQRPGG